MNIVNKSILLLTATLITGLISIQSHANMFGGSGQYVMMTNVTKTHTIWVMNTETGQVRSCFYTGDAAPKCTPWSEK